MIFLLSQWIKIISILHVSLLNFKEACSNSGVTKGGKRGSRPPGRSTRGAQN